MELFNIHQKARRNLGLVVFIQENLIFKNNLFLYLNPIKINFQKYKFIDDGKL